LNIAVIGASTIKDELKKKISKAGFVPVVIEDAGAVEKIEGEKYQYILHLNGREVRAGFIIIAGQCCIKDEKLLAVPFEALCNLETECYSGYRNTPAIFLMDYPKESPTAFTAEALKKATAIAHKKNNVIYLARFLKTAGDGIESLYSEARNAGVAFLKYTKLLVDYNPDSEVFNITFSDGYEEIGMETDSLILGQNLDQEDDLSKIAELLRLKKDEYGELNENRCFLYPYLTSRKGIYHINVSTDDFAKTDASECMEHVINDIKNEMKNIFGSRTSCEKFLGLAYGFSDRLTECTSGYAEIDPGKCAFCYTCFRACPHAAMVPDYENSVMKNLKNACNACGVCVSVCPAKAVSIIEEENTDSLEAEKGSYDKPEAKSSKALKILCCENSAEHAVKKLKKEIPEAFDCIDTECVPCGGGIEASYILELLKSYDRVLVAVCMDDACKHFEGNKRAFGQVRKVKEMLKASGLDEDRVDCVKLSHAIPGAIKEHVLSDSFGGGIV
jgi:coenzyme F420-reducing hydrogenase delta subunit/Pyruvate/2-oxoacid:ferredoxin oxidoreductase delta subunit